MVEEVQTLANEILCVNDYLLRRRTNPDIVIAWGLESKTHGNNIWKIAKICLFDFTLESNPCKIKIYDMELNDWTQIDATISSLCEQLLRFFFYI